MRQSVAIFIDQWLLLLRAQRFINLGIPGPACHYILQTDQLDKTLGFQVGKPLRPQKIPGGLLLVALSSLSSGTNHSLNYCCCFILVFIHVHQYTRMRRQLQRIISPDWLDRIRSDPQRYTYTYIRTSIAVSFLLKPSDMCSRIGCLARKEIFKSRFGRKKKNISDVWHDGCKDWQDWISAAVEEEWIHPFIFFWLFFPPPSFPVKSGGLLLTRGGGRRCQTEDQIQQYFPRTQTHPQIWSHQGKALKSFFHLHISVKCQIEKAKMMWNFWPAKKFKLSDIVFDQVQRLAYLTTTVWSIDIYLCIFLAPFLSWYLFSSLKKTKLQRRQTTLASSCLF